MKKGKNKERKEGKQGKEGGQEGGREERDEEREDGEERKEGGRWGGEEGIGSLMLCIYEMTSALGDFWAWPAGWGGLRNTRTSRCHGLSVCGAAWAPVLLTAPHARSRGCRMRRAAELLCCLRLSLQVAGGTRKTSRQSSHRPAAGMAENTAPSRTRRTGGRLACGRP